MLSADKKLLIKCCLYGLSPFILFDILLGSIFPAGIPISMLFAFVYATGFSRINSTTSKKHVGYLLLVLYFSAVFIVFGVFCRIVIYQFAIMLIASLVALLLISATKKMKFISCLAIFTNLCTALVFIMFTPPSINHVIIESVRNDKYADVLYSFEDFDSVLKNGKIKSKYQGVRSIIIDSNERFAYFSADTGKMDAGEPVPTIFRTELADNHWTETVTTGDRSFGLAFSPDEKYLFATGYYSKNLFAINTRDLKIDKTIKTSSYPQFIIVDEKGNILTVLHEGLGIANVYSLPDLKFYRKSKISASPSKLIVDTVSRTMFSSNWMYPYLLTETEIYSQLTRRKKYFLSFAGSGIDIDRSHNKVFVANSFAGYIYGIDRMSWEQTDRIKVRPVIRSLCVDDTRNLIYAGNMADPRIRVFDYEGNLLGSIYAGANCREIVKTPKSNRILAGTIIGLVELNIESFLADHKKN